MVDIYRDDPSPVDVIRVGVEVVESERDGV